MKLITKQLEREFAKHPMGSIGEVPDINDVPVVAKFFGGFACTWIVLEAEKQEDGDWLFYGLANLGYGYEAGYFTLSEIDIKFPPFGLGLERDMYLPKDCKVRDLVREEEWI